MSSTETPAVPSAEAFALTPFPDPGELVDLQQDLFGEVAHDLSLDDVKRAIRGVVRPRDLRPLITKSTHDPLLNMLELAMKAKTAGQDELAFKRFAEVLPYVWTRVVQSAMPGLDGAVPGSAGQVTYTWMTPTEPQG